MSPFKIRSLLKAEMIDDPEARERYKQYEADEREVKATYTAGYRAMEKGGHMGMKD